MSDLDPGVAGHDYSDGAPVEPWHGLAATRDYGPGGLVEFSSPDSGNPFVDSRRPIRELIYLMHGMPFCGLVKMKVPSYNGDMIEFMVATSDWLHDYRRVIQSQSDDFTRQAQVVRDMQNERAAVRGFFGLPTDDYS